MRGVLTADHLPLTINQIDLPELPQHYKGKVRENYTLANGTRIIVASDRLSAFDTILTAIPFKGEVLTQTAKFWFENVADICPNHVVSYPDPNVLVARQLDMLPIEIVVRRYLTGSTSTALWPAYKAGKREMYGFHFPEGLRENEQLPEAILTPTTKPTDGTHDEPITPAEILNRKLVTPEQWAQLSDYAMRLFARGQEMADRQGLILVDTKYEFGIDAEGKVTLADEIHTPDSSRYWLKDSYHARFEKGEKPQSFDKDFIRSWVAERCNPYKDPIPEIPAEMVLKTAEVYINAYEKITGQLFDLTGDREDPATRIRKNLKAFF